MHYRVPPKRTPATKTGRDTSVTQQYHFGVTVADQDCSNAAAFELVLDGRRVSPAAVKAMPMAERQRVTRPGYAAPRDAPPKELVGAAQANPGAAH